MRTHKEVKPVIRKPKKTAFAPRSARWWSAPARLPAATLALLRRVAFHRDFPNDPWVRQTPNGIRA